ncbi:pyruvate formate lyase family protein [Candidatus Epulonipiscium viviparus]|uniref:pyruvate formate lyase family protein n=1 Tax=Candidatus Epulonipiscium viviparus TaxID=420336 RepID=UPI00016C007F|nr:pyruvate formate lyase family protein [Candidatus Epulopiscium viviparus]
MSNFKLNGAQNVEVSKKLPSEKSIEEQIVIMENYTNIHNQSLHLSKEEREINCLKTIYPALFRTIENHDLIAGRLDFLPIGFGCVTSLGGVGHFCVFQKLLALKDQSNQEQMARIDNLYNYWQKHDTKAKYCKDVLNDTTVGPFIDCNYPFMATARLSGMMLDYPKLLDNGIEGLKDIIKRKSEVKGDSKFYKCSIKALELLQTCILDLIKQIDKQIMAKEGQRVKELLLMKQDLLEIVNDKPKTFHQALQLVWIYALLAGVINYGRLDDYLGVYLVQDLENNIITEVDAYNYLKSFWTLIENRRTTVNGRIIVGGYGRKNPKEADVFARIAMNVTKECKYVEPQFTLRFNKQTPKDIMDLAYDCLGAGATYPTLYNDDVNVDAVMYGMRIDRVAAEQYVPFGCTEFVIQGQSVGTPNVLMNVLKMLNIYMNEGIDTFDGIYKADKCVIPPLNNYADFESFYAGYKEFVDYFIQLSAKVQLYSYEVMNNEVSFLFTSILIDDCLERNKALLEGGVRYLGGTNEIYGSINASDSLYAIKKLVFEQKKYTLEEVNTAVNANFCGYEKIRYDLVNCDKYGNDLEEVDELANDLYEFIAKGVRWAGMDSMQYYLIVISNNQANTEWGRKTEASADGRLRGTYLNPANNPQAGAAKNGPTAMLNSLRKFNPKYHGGSVQNIKFTPNMFNGEREKIKALFDAYFNNGGCHLMVTVVDKGVLEDAQQNPQDYPELIVRVSGFSAVFVDLDVDVQDEVISRVLYGN